LHCSQEVFEFKLAHHDGLYTDVAAEKFEDKQAIPTTADQVMAKPE